MMPHMQEVHRRTADALLIAQLSNPDALAKQAYEYTAPVLALCSIIARGHWMLVNGHWLRKQEDGVRL